MVFMHKLVTVLLFLCAGIGVYAQSGSVLDMEKLTSKVAPSSSSLLTAEQLPVADVIDPNVYVVGPGDVIGYQTTGLDFSEKLAVISPESSLMLERLGVINARDLTLSQLRDSIKNRIAERTPTIEVFVTLKRARIVYVTLKGNVPFPGTYAVPASTRVSSLIQLSRQPWLLRTDPAVTELVRAYGTSVTQNSAEVMRTGGPQISAYALRNIVVRHREGVSVVDLVRARVRGFEKYDPHLREGDVVEIPFDNSLKSTISIAGAVATPAVVAYKPTDHASILLAAAGGPTEDADLERVYLVLGGGSGKVTLTVDENLRIVGDDPELQPGSSIVVERKVVAGSAVRQGVVEVYGEVQKPGSVVITPGVTRISEVIAAAGGLKAAAAPSLSYIVRPDHQSFSQREVSENSFRRFMYSDLVLEDTIRFQLDQHYKIPFVSCDFATALRDTSSDQNVTLNSGDIIVVQPTPERVFVYGQVNQPGFVQYVPKKPMEWYIEQAGGFATGASEGRARIIRGKTKVWVEDDNDVYVEPGDEVYAPRPPAVPVGTQLQTYAIVAGMLSSVVALTATIISLARR